VKKDNWRYHQLKVSKIFTVLHHQWVLT